MKIEVDIIQTGILVNKCNQIPALFDWRKNIGYELLGGDRMIETEITDYDKWKFRRCIETLNRYGCKGTGIKNNDKCPKCKFNISEDKWDYLHIKLMLNNDPDRILYNYES